jgi:hypothetical protein
MEPLLNCEDVGCGALFQASKKVGEINQSKLEPLGKVVEVVRFHPILMVMHALGASAGDCGQLR